MTGNRPLLPRLALVGRVVATASIATIIAGGLATGHRVAFGSNHVGYSPSEFWPYWTFCVVVGFANLLLGKRNRVVAVCLLALCLLIPPCVHLLDRFNLLVPYEEWIRRGMPPKPWS